MNNKVLIKIIFPELDKEFDLFIPVNEQIWKINKMAVKSIFDLSGISLEPKAEYLIMNKRTGKFYDGNQTILDTDIRNGTEIVMIRCQN